MKLIVLAAAKGGVGKTTFAAALSTAAIIEKPDARIGIVDLDPQGALTGWWNARALPPPLLFNRQPEALAYAPIRLLDERLDLLILDRPPGFSFNLEQAKTWPLSQLQQRWPRGRECRSASC
jgi:chromosome partitioning protein